MPNGQAASPVEAKIEELMNKSPKIEVEGEILFLLEGDLLLDDLELEEYAKRQVALDEMHRIRETGGGVGLAPRPSPELVGITENGKIVRWAPGVVLSYCVLKGTFSSDAHYEEARDNMLAATQAWMDTCGVQFENKDPRGYEEFRTQFIEHSAQGSAHGGR